MPTIGIWIFNSTGRAPPTGFASSSGPLPVTGRAPSGGGAHAWRLFVVASRAAAVRASEWPEEPRLRTRESRCASRRARLTVARETPAKAPM